ncbi:MAG: stage III sporulation protein AE [Corallococcus sp.]|nr:stage III sporulation protein AE [Corallococcus sp.]
MKKIFLVIVLCLLVAMNISPYFAYADTADDLNNTINNQLGNIDFSDTQSIADGTFVGDVVAKIKQILNGEFDDAKDFLAFILSAFFSEFKTLLPQLITILVIAIVISLLSKHAAFASKGTGNVVYLAGFATIISLSISVLFAAYKSVYSVIAQISQITDICMPIMITLMIANGNVVSAKVYQPMVAMLSGTIIKIIDIVILPLCAFSLIFSIISSLSDNIKIGKISKFFTSSCGWLLGVVFMVFSAFMSVQGITAATADGISIRAAKFATKSYIPLLGGYLSDGFDLIMAGTTLIKNSFGIVTLLITFSTVLVPILTILTLNIGFHFISAVAEPVCDSKYVSFFGKLSKNLTFLALILIAVGFMFLIMVMLSIYTANGIGGV